MYCHAWTCHPSLTQIHSLEAEASEQSLRTHVNQHKQRHITWENHLVAAAVEASLVLRLVVILNEPVQIVILVRRSSSSRSAAASTSNLSEDIKGSPALDRAKHPKQSIRQRL